MLCRTISFTSGLVQGRFEMRIAILGTRGIPARYGGFETFADNISRLLVREGFKVTVFCEATNEERQSIYDGVNLVYVAAPRLGPLRTIAYDLVCLWQARRRYDLVYMLGYGASIFCFLPRLWGTKVWINVDGLEWTRRKWNFLARTYLHLMEGIATWMPDRIIADARSIRTDLRTRYSVRVPCDVIPYGCDLLMKTPGLEALTQRGLKAGGYYLVICRFEPENHIREIVDGFLSTNSERSLVLIGNDKASTPYVSRLLECKDQRVRFLGPVYESEQLNSLRFHCTAYIHGHSVGGTNPSLLEAMGCANLIVAHDNRFNREVLGNAGLYFETPDDLRRMVTEIDSGEVQEQQLRKRSKSRAAEYYNWPLITSAYKERFLSADTCGMNEIDIAPQTDLVLQRDALFDQPLEDCKFDATDSSDSLSKIAT
jgi:glycosyltransferase involved in cell wall biosynthesis